MKLTAVLTILAAVLASAMAPTVGAAPDAASAAAPLREFEGTVVSVNRDARRFRLRDSERGTVRIRVTNRTRFERLAGLAALQAGMTGIEANVRRSNRAWVAVEVERSGGGGNHGGDNGGDDDR